MPVWARGARPGPAERMGARDRCAGAAWLSGVRKSTLARALSEALRAADVAHGVIDMDELGLVHPDPGRSFPRENLRAVWPNYVAAVSGIRLIIPMVFSDEEEVGLI